MTQLRNLLTTNEQEQAMWELKDSLRLLHANPIYLHKGKFVEYLEVKADALYAENLADGMTHEVAIRVAQIALNETVVEWKAEAKRRNTNLRPPS